MNLQNTRQTAVNSIGASLAAVATFAILASVNLLAVQPHAAADAAMAASPGSTQVVVVVGQRLARS